LIIQEKALLLQDILYDDVGLEDQFKLILQRENFYRGIRKKIMGRRAVGIQLNCVVAIPLTTLMLTRVCILGVNFKERTDIDFQKKVMFDQKN
jgi:hypothetical protein